jgi:hypothetical protein
MASIGPWASEMVNGVVFRKNCSFTLLTMLDTYSALGSIPENADEDPGDRSAIRANWPRRARLKKLLHHLFESVRALD